MRRARLVLLPLLLSGPFASLSAAQSAATAPPQAATTQQPAASVTSVQLGASAVELGGLWKFHVGDDLAWAQPTLDDSSWKTLDLTPPAGSADPTIPGWTATGYPDYSGFAWYRLRVNVDGAAHTLALKMPDSADDAYQVYVNGSLVGEFGNFKSTHIVAYSTQPQEYRLPKAVRNGPMTIAIRMWMDSSTPFVSPDAGGMHGPPVLGFASVIATQTQLDWDETDHEVGSGFLEALILFMALVMAVCLFWLDPDEKAYLWLAIVTGVTLLGNTVVLIVNYTTWIGQTSGQILIDLLLTALRTGLWVLFWAYWFRLWRLPVIHKIVWSLVVLLAVGNAMLRPPLYGQFFPVHAASMLVTALLVPKLILAVLLFVVSFYGFKRQRTEGWMAGIAILLGAIANYQRELRLIHIKTTFTLFDYTISLGTASTILSLLIITVMLLRRFVHSERCKEQWRLEIEQAREIQQVLLPSKLPSINGLAIESEYRPAREVGGDFFQIIPGKLPGTALIVVGDVTGKGLQAGMLVALLVGSIRTAAQHHADPARILSLTNDGLCEREHASATCMILQIAADGEVLFANAGQLPPYLNGVEMEIEGDLPLGTIPGIEYSVQSFRMQKGDNLILMSDGVAEAQDAHGNLFGFERVAELVKSSTSASQIAASAQKFGQEDDILVLRIERETQTFDAPLPA
jgi:hypothetical protein